MSVTIRSSYGHPGIPKRFNGKNSSRTTQIFRPSFFISWQHWSDKVPTFCTPCVTISMTAEMEPAYSITQQQKFYFLNAKGREKRTTLRRKGEEDSDKIYFCWRTAESAKGRADRELSLLLSIALMSNPHPLRAPPHSVQQQQSPWLCSSVYRTAGGGVHIPQWGDGQVHKKYPITSTHYACAKGYLRDIRWSRVQFHSHWPLQNDSWP
jgi:hypothetical protein